MSKKQTKKDKKGEVEVVNQQIVKKDLENEIIEWTISAGFAGVLSNGENSFSNKKPFFNITKKHRKHKNEIYDPFQEIKEIEEGSYSLFLDCNNREVKAHLERLFPTMRFYPVGLDRYISVTSILSILPEDQINMDTFELMQYASAGTITHARLEFLAKYGILIEDEKELLEKIPAIKEDYNLVKKSSLQLDVLQGDLRALLTKYPIRLLCDNLLKEKVEKPVKPKSKKAEQVELIIEEVVNKENDITPVLITERKVFNHKEKYAGTLDLIGYPMPEFEGANPNLLTIFDLKRTGNSEKNFMQMAAYAKAFEEETGQKIEQMIVLICASGGSKPKQGFSKPLISQDIDTYYEKFLKKRNEVYAYLYKNGFRLE